jgi:predicted dehydrogenase
MTGESVSVALLGLGRMGRVHARAIAVDVPSIELRAVAEERTELVDRAREESLIGHAAVYARADEALADPDIRACIVVTPTDTHAPIVRAALDRGLHVFCEKPLTLDLAQGAELAELSERSGLVLQVGFWRRYCPAFVEAKRCLDAGAIGRPIFARSSQWDAQAPAPEWCAPERSGGIFVDMGVHDIDELEWLLDDRVTEVEGRPFANADPAIADAGDYDNAAMLLRFAGGAQGLIDLSRNGRYADDLRVEILGTDGAILIETYPTARVRMGDRDGLRTVWEEPGVDIFVAGIVAELQAFARAVSSPADAAVPSAVESNRATLIADVARASAAREAPIEIPRSLPVDIGTIM